MHNSKGERIKINEARLTMSNKTLQREFDARTTTTLALLQGIVIGFYSFSSLK